MLCRHLQNSLFSGALAPRLGMLLEWWKLLDLDLMTNYPPVPCWQPDPSLQQALGAGLTSGQEGSQLSHAEQGKHLLIMLHK